MRICQPRETARFWVIDYRVFDPDADGKTKLDHVRDMLHSVSHRAVPFETVLMDSWYATKDLMVLIEEMAKKYYCPLKSNRQVDDSGGEHPYRRVDALEWSERELERGKLVKVKGFPKEHKVRLFRVVVHSRRTEWIVTNGSDSGFGARRATGARLALEDRGVSPGSQAVNGDRALPVPWRGRIQRNHIACAMLVWSRLKHLAYQSGRTPSTGSNMACCKIISSNNSRVLPFRWFLRKS